jgi:aldehyde dehydrogenase (NAD+)
MEFLQELQIKAENPGVSTGKDWIPTKGLPLDSFSPVDGKRIATISSTDKESYEKVVSTAGQAFTEWRNWPAPRRGEVVRQIGEALRQHKTELGHLVSYEMGKSLQEGYGEVQEMIDICDFAVGLSRQLHGLTMHSERPPTGCMNSGIPWE